MSPAVLGQGDAESARISAALMAPDPTAAVMSGAMRKDRARALIARRRHIDGEGCPRGWPNLPPGLPPPGSGRRRGGCLTLSRPASGTTAKGRAMVSRWRSCQH